MKLETNDIVKAYADAKSPIPSLLVGDEIIVSFSIGSREIITETKNHKTFSTIKTSNKIRAVKVLNHHNFHDKDMFNTQKIRKQYGVRDTYNADEKAELLAEAEEVANEENNSQNQKEITNQREDESN